MTKIQQTYKILHFHLLQVFQIIKKKLISSDKEILVFDINNNFEMIRKFGLNILNRPFGLTFDPSGNLVLVDANNRNPLIYRFNPITGALVKSSTYKPVIKSFSQSSLLTASYSGGLGKSILSKDVKDFEQSKVRFIGSNQNTLYASDLGRSIIFKTNLEGEIELAFGFHGRKKGELYEPSGIHVDNDGCSLLVGDSKNDRVQVSLSNYFSKNFKI